MRELEFKGDSDGADDFARDCEEFRLESSGRSAGLPEFSSVGCGVYDGVLSVGEARAGHETRAGGVCFRFPVLPPHVFRLVFLRSFHNLLRNSGREGLHDGFL